MLGRKGVLGRKGCQEGKGVRKEEMTGRKEGNEEGILGEGTKEGR
jgi:hypothetical protein